MSTGIIINARNEWSGGVRKIKVQADEALVKLEVESFDGDRSALLTPDQARKLAEHLVATADEATANGSTVEVYGDD